jgi:DNA/RNA endonuclease YhcR with UshA esterase domain
MEEQMKKLLGGLGLLTLMAFSVFTVPSQAAAATKKITVTPKYQYDVSKEVTLKGTISSVVKKPTGGTLVGEHLMLATSSGTVDAHIGSFAGRDKHLDSLTQGQSVSVVGVKMNVKGKDVFIVRTVEADGQTYTVRNQHGAFAGSGAPKAAASKANASNGGWR